MSGVEAKLTVHVSGGRRMRSADDLKAALCIAIDQLDEQATRSKVDAAWGSVEVQTDFQEPRSIIDYFEPATYTLSIPATPRLTKENDLS